MPRDLNISAPKQRSKPKAPEAGIATANGNEIVHLSAARRLSPVAVVCFTAALLVGLLLGPAPGAQAASVTANPGTAATISDGTYNACAWKWPGEADSSDDSETIISHGAFDNNDVSERLDLTNFGFTIPAGASIDGVMVEIERRFDAGGDGRV